MHRAAWVAAAIVSLAAPAWGDAIDDRITELAADNYKLRLASVLALSKSSDPRALRALSRVLEDASEKSLRRIAVVGLSKRAAEAPAALRAELSSALARAARSDRDAKVRSAAARAAKRLASLPAPAPPAPVLPKGDRPTAPVADAPALFVKINSSTDATGRLGTDVLEVLTRTVAGAVSQRGFSTTWPGALPTTAELTASSTRAFMVVATVKKLEVKTPAARGAEVSCTVSIMVAPWQGVDGKELWEADRAATAAGSARAETGGSAREIRGGMRDCVEAVATEVATRQVAPFLRRMAKQ